MKELMPYTMHEYAQFHTHVEFIHFSAEAMMAAVSSVSKQTPYLYLLLLLLY